MPEQAPPGNPNIKKAIKVLPCLIKAAASCFSSLADRRGRVSRIGAFISLLCEFKCLEPLG